MFMNRFVLAVGLGISAAACGASDRGDVERQIELQPAVAVPEGHASVEEGVLRVEVTGLESLEQGHHVVWVDGGDDGPRRAGVLEEGLLVAELENVKSGWRCFVTEEGDAEPDGPASSLRLEGRVEGDLWFDRDFTAGGLRSATGSCRLSDQEVDLGVRNLPRPPDGLHYAAWAVCPHSPDRHDDEPTSHDDESTSHDDESTSHDDDTGHHDESLEEEIGHSHAWDDDTDADANEPILLGQVEQGTLHRRHADRVGGCESVFLTLESSRGVDAPSPIRVMHGDVVFPEAEADDAHMH